jgi:heterodisulfide reductase subunit B
MENGAKKLSFFPGCSLATSAKESKEAFLRLFAKLGYDVEELTDWNCCGSSSTHSVDSGLAFRLAARILSLVPEGRSLLVACPSCNLRLSEAHYHLVHEPEKRAEFKDLFGKEYNTELEITRRLKILDMVDWDTVAGGRVRDLADIRFVPYYGCMLNRPAHLREKNYSGLMEKVLERLGATPLQWAQGSKCCGTFLTATRPDVVAPIVDDIMFQAMQAGADCIVTACAMCQLNLELRCTLPKKIPILLFSDLICLAMGEQPKKEWFSKHLVDPRPLLKSRRLI